MRNSLALSLAVCSLVTAMLACGTAAPAGPTGPALGTALAQTAIVVLTGTAQALVTATQPAVPTPTPLPTTTTAPPTATATATVVLDTPTPAQSPTPCTNDSAFGADVTIPDGTHFAANAPFVKTWRLRNDGQCTWTTAYQIRYINGQNMGQAAVNLPNEVPPGASLEISVSFTAPGSNGRFTSQYQLFSPEGAAFGTKPYVEIVVP